jgi:uncharacterized protein DUF6265
MEIRLVRAPLRALLLLAAVSAANAFAQAAPQQPAAPPPAGESKAPTAAPAAQDATPVEGAAPTSDSPSQFAWLAGCWQGSVNGRDFREQWQPLRSDVMVGTWQLVWNGRMQDYQFLRLERRSGGLYFSQFSGDRNELSFRFSQVATDEKDTVFTFTNTAAAFPARLLYRRGSDGWLYETVEGPLDGSDKRVIYPLRRVDCESGDFIRQ